MDGGLSQSVVGWPQVGPEGPGSLGGKLAQGPSGFPNHDDDDVGDDDDDDDDDDWLLDQSKYHARLDTG